MASPLDVTMILCDHAVADQSGKIHMLGAGWSVTGSPTSPHGIALLIKIPWDRANQKIHFVLQLLDSDGHPVVIKSPDNVVAIRNEMEVEVGRPPGLPQGSPLDAAVALNIQPLPLGVGRYEWRLEYDKESLTASFLVRGTPDSG